MKQLLVRLAIVIIAGVVIFLALIIAGLDQRFHRPDVTPLAGVMAGRVR